MVRPLMRPVAWRLFIVATLALAAYNAGAERVEEARGVPSIVETREYLERVLRYRLAYLREAAGARHPAKGL